MNAAMTAMPSMESMPVSIGGESIREYDAKIDSKKRLTLRGASYEYYHVREFSNGTIELEPRVLTKPFEIAADTLEMMLSSAENFKKGIVSEPIDLSEFEDEAESSETNEDED